MSGLTFWFAFLLVISIFTRYFILPKYLAKIQKNLKNMLKKHIMIWINTTIQVMNGLKK